MQLVLVHDETLAEKLLGGPNLEREVVVGFGVDVDLVDVGLGVGEGVGEGVGVTVSRLHSLYEPH